MMLQVIKGRHGRLENDSLIRRGCREVAKLYRLNLSRQWRSKEELQSLVIGGGKGGWDTKHEGDEFGVDAQSVQNFHSRFGFAV